MNQTKNINRRRFVRKSLLLSSGSLCASSVLGNTLRIFSSGSENIKYITVASKKGRFFGWPANNGMWKWRTQQLLDANLVYRKLYWTVPNTTQNFPQKWLIMSTISDLTPILQTNSTKYLKKDTCTALYLFFKKHQTALLGPMLISSYENCTNFVVTIFQSVSHKT